MKFIVTINGMIPEDRDDVQGSLEEELRNMGWSAEVEPANIYTVYSLVQLLEETK